MLARLLDPRSVYSGGGLFFGGGVTQWAMRRAIVISVLVHLLILVSLLELPTLPAGESRKANGSLPLSVSFKFAGAIDKRDAPFPGAAPPTAKQPARELLAQDKTAVSPAVAKRHGKGPARQKESLPLPDEAAENLAFLPADLEREYRINLARAARQSRYYPAALVAKGEQGVVRMAILYWRRLGAPSVTLEQSSGYRELDQEALKALALAIGTVPLPAGAQGDFRMLYTLEYRLDD